MKVGIVGAGAAGLAAAFDLGNAGHEVVVYESAPFIGGQASTIPVGGTPWNAVITISSPMTEPYWT